MKPRPFYLLVFVMVFLILVFSGCAAKGITEISPTSFKLPSWTLALSISDKVAGTTCTKDNIALINSDGTNLKEIISGGTSTFDENPSWSPDGTRIAYTSGTGDYPSYSIWIVNADGSGK